VWDTDALTCLAQTGDERPQTTAAQHCAKTVQCVYEGDKHDKLQKGCIFRARTWNMDSLTGRAGEVVKVLDDIEVDAANTTITSSDISLTVPNGKNFIFFKTFTRVESIHQKDSQ